MAKYIYEYKNWTDFSWQDKAINAVFGEVRLMQGKIIGQMNDGLILWMEKHKFNNIDEFRGKINQYNTPNPAVFERVQFMKLYSKIE